MHSADVVCHVKNDTSLAVSATASASDQLDDHSMCVDAMSCATSFCADGMHSVDDKNAVSPDVSAIVRSHDHGTYHSLCVDAICSATSFCANVVCSAGKFSDELGQQINAPVWVFSHPGKSTADDAAFESLHLDQDLTSYIRADISQSECSDEHGQQTDVHVKMSSLSDKRDIDSSISINTMRRKNKSKQIASMQMSEMLTSFCADVMCSATTVVCPPELRASNSPLTRIPDVLLQECDCASTCHAGYAFNDHQKCHILARSMLSHTNTIRVCRPSVR